MVKRIKKTAISYAALFAVLLVLVIIDVVIATDQTRATGTWMLDNFRINVVLAMQIILLVVGIMISVVRIKTHKSFSLVWLLMALPLFYVFSEDFFAIMELNIGVQQRAVYPIALFLIISCYYHLIRIKMIDRAAQKLELWWLVGNLVAMTIYVAVNVTAVRVIAASILLLSTLPIFYLIVDKRAKGSLLAGILLASAVFMVALQLLKTSGLLHFAYTLVFAILSSVISFFAALFFVLLSYRDDKLALQKAELEKVVSEVKSKALLSQIKPEFIFNSLSLIKQGYHTSREEGDLAMDLFSRHLRANVDANITEMVDIDVELSLVGNYFELENLRQNSHIQLLFDVEIKNFRVPVLSLLPIVENSIRHAGLQHVKDAYISIKTYKAEDGVGIEIKDNGCGFSMVEGYEGTGLINAKERLFYALGAKVVINSIVGEGTTTTILIPENRAEGFLQEENI